MTTFCTYGIKLGLMQPLPEIRQKLLAYGFARTFQEGEIILKENSFTFHTYRHQGNMRVMQTDEEGREILLYYIKVGETCIMSFLGGMHHDTSKINAIAEEDTEILFIPIEKVSSLIREFRNGFDYIFRLYHKRFEELFSVVNAIAFKKLDVHCKGLYQEEVCDYSK